MKDLVSTVVRNEEIAQNIFAMTLGLPEDVGKIRGGQFLNLSTGDNSRLLRRPFGIMKSDAREVTVCYQVKGEGTRYLAARRAGDKLRVLLPLGNFFDLDGYKSVAVVGGGVGIFPLVATIREHYLKKDFYSYIGFRSSGAVCLLDELKRSKSLTVSTDDGSFGVKGNAVQCFMEDIDKLGADAIISCGPPVMLKALKRALTERKIKIPCFLSLEERMGCGLGACLVCVCNGADGERLRVCRDGPVFEMGEVEL